MKQSVLGSISFGLCGLLSKKECNRAEGKKMLNEFQPKTIDFCKHCGAALINSEDWIKPRWEDEDCWSGCLHEAANDPELEEIVKEIDEIVNRINESTRKINAIKTQQYKISPND